MLSKNDSTAIIACIVAAGCAGLADEDTTPPPLATITGTLTLSDGAIVPDEQLRLAVLWQTKGRYDEGSESVGVCTYPDGTTLPAGLSLDLFTQQQVDLDGTFPNQFVLDLTAPPPEPIDPDDLGTVGGRVNKGFGFLVAYADGNANGRLDARAGGEASADRVLGTTVGDYMRTYEPGEDLQVLLAYSPQPQEVRDWIYADGFHSFPAGYSQARIWEDREGEELRVMTRVEPIETPIDLRLSGAPYLQDLMCETPCHLPDDEFQCPENPMDLPLPQQDSVRFTWQSQGSTDGQTYFVNYQGYGWSHGVDGNSMLLDACYTDPVFGQGYTWQMEVCENCTCRSKSCDYRAMGNSGVDASPGVSELCAARE